MLGGVSGRCAHVSEVMGPGTGARENRGWWLCTAVFLAGGGAWAGTPHQDSPRAVAVKAKLV